MPVLLSLQVLLPLPEVLVSRLGFNDRLLTFRTRREVASWRGLVSRCCRLWLSVTTANRRSGCRFSWQRRVHHNVINLLLVLWLCQCIVQIALNFYALLAFRRNRCLALSGVDDTGGRETSCGVVGVTWRSALRKSPALAVHHLP